MGPLRKCNIADLVIKIGAKLYNIISPISFEALRYELVHND